MYLREHTRWLRDVLQHLGANHKVESFVTQRKLLPSGNDIHQSSRAEVDSNVPVQSIGDQFTIRLNSSANIEDFQFTVRKLVQPVLENLATLSKHEPIRIGERREKAVPALLY